MNVISIARIAFNRLRYGRGVAAPRKPTSEQLAFYGRLVGPGSLVFDVGANVGDKAAVFLALGAHVVAFEPQPVCAKTLRKRFVGNRNLEVVEEGVADEPGELSMSVCASAKTISTFSPDWKEGRFRDFRWDEEIVVPVTTLDEAIERFGMPSFVKIDVEGFEESVLEGLSAPAGTLSFEFAREFADKTARCLELATKIGYRGFSVALGEEPALITAGWMDTESIITFIRESDDESLWGDIYARLEDPRSS